MSCQYLLPLSVKNPGNSVFEKFCSMLVMYGARDDALNQAGGDES